MIRAVVWVALVSVGCSSKAGLAPTNEQSPPPAGERVEGEGPPSGAEAGDGAAGAAETAGASEAPAPAADNAQAEIARLTQQLEELEQKIAVATDDMLVAASDRERADAGANLASLRKQRDELQRRIMDARAAASQARSPEAGTSE